MGLKAEARSAEGATTPRDWDIRPLREILDFRNGVNAEKAAYGRGVRFINVLEIITNSHLTACDVPGRIDIDPRTAAPFLVQRGDVVFNRASETAEEAGLAAVYMDDEPLVFGGFVIRGRPKAPDDLDPAYIGYALRAKAVRTQIVARAQGAIRVNVGQSELRAVLVSVPKLPEQRAIAAVLRDTDALISSLDRLIAKKRDVTRAVMRQLLTGSRRLPGFVGGWQTKSFGQVLSRVQTKGHQVPVSDYQRFGALPIVDQGKEFIAAFTDRAEKRFRCPEGGVIVFGDHTCVVKFVDFDFVPGADGTQILAAKRGANARFVALLLQHSRVTPTGYSRHFAVLQEQEFRMPAIEEQVAIASVVSDLDAEIAALEQRRDKTKLLKQAMMQELLTGRTRLK